MIHPQLHHRSLVQWGSEAVPTGTWRQRGSTGGHRATTDISTLAKLPLLKHIEYIFPAVSLSAELILGWWEVGAAAFVRRAHILACRLRHTHTCSHIRFRRLLFTARSSKSNGLLCSGSNRLQPGARWRQWFWHLPKWGPILAWQERELDRCHGPSRIAVSPPHTHTHTDFRERPAAPHEAAAIRQNMVCK